MSHDGFTQYWCTKGHTFRTDHLQEMDAEDCRYCGSSIAFTHSVDQTNGYMNDAIDTEVVKKAKMCTCHACGHMHELEPARYRIPDRNDVRKAKRRRRMAELRDERERMREVD